MGNLGEALTDILEDIAEDKQSGKHQSAEDPGESGKPISTTAEH